MKKFICFIVSLMLLVSMAIPAMADTEIPMDAYAVTKTGPLPKPVMPEPVTIPTNKVSEYTLSKEATPSKLTDDERETTITLSIEPCEKRKVICLIVDISNSTLYSSTIEEIIDIINRFANDKAELMLIAYKGKAENLCESCYGTTTIHVDSDTVDKIKTMMLKSIFNLDGGTNSDSGNLLALDELSAMTDVDDANKIVIHFTDAGTNEWGRIPTGVFSQYYKHYKISEKGAALNMIGQNYDVFYYRFDNGIGMTHTIDFDELYAWAKDDPMFVGDMAFDKVGVQSTIFGVTVPSFSVEEYELENAEQFSYEGYKTAYLITPEDNYAESIVYLEANPYVIYRSGDEYYANFDEPNPYFYQNYYTTGEKACVRAAMSWDELNKHYKCATIFYDDQDGGTGKVIHQSFGEWLVENSNLGGAHLSDAEEIDNLINTVSDEVDLMSCSMKGQVIDQIPDMFEFVPNSEKVMLTDTEDVTEFSANGDNPLSDGQIVFDATSNTIYWNIDMDYEPDEIRLIYTLKFIGTESGVYDTNVYAEFTPDGEDALVFPIPQVEYEAPEISDEPEEPDEPEIPEEPEEPEEPETPDEPEEPQEPDEPEEPRVPDEPDEPEEPEEPIIPVRPIKPRKSHKIIIDDDTSVIYTNPDTGSIDTITPTIVVCIVCVIEIIIFITKRLILTNN